MREMASGGGKTGFHTSLEPHRRPRPAIQEGSETKRDARRIPLRDRASVLEGKTCPVLDKCTGADVPEAMPGAIRGGAV